MSRKTWHDLVYDAIISEGGIASLSEIYSWFEQEVPSRLYRTWKQAVRRSLLDHTSDSEGYKGGSDLFYSVKGLRSGVWGIRLKWLEDEEDTDFNQLGRTLLELDEYDLSEEVFRHAIAIDSIDTDSKIGLAKTMAEKGQLTKDIAQDILESIVLEIDQFPEEIIKKGKVRTRRKGSTKSPSKTETVYIRKKIVTRMNKREAELVGDFAEWLSSEKGVIPIFEKDYEDVRFQYGGKSYSVEAKYVKGTATKAIRSALGQLLYYNMYPNSSTADILLILIQSEPTENDKDWISSLRSRFGESLFPMYICWKSANEFLIDGISW